MPLAEPEPGVIRSYKGKTPRIAEDAFVSEAAYVVGDVEIGAGSSVWPGAVVRADFAPIRIGSNTHIEDNSTLHQGDPIDIGDNVTIGHNVVVHCRRIGHNTLIANHATLLDRAEVGAGCVVAAGAVLRPDTKVPDGSFVAGVPATIQPLSESQRTLAHDFGSTYRELADSFRAEGLGDPLP